MQDRGAYLRVLVPQRCVLVARRRSSARLGRRVPAAGRPRARHAVVQGRVLGRSKTTRSGRSRTAMTRQRTYWHLQALGRKPTDYDIASSRLLYHPERGFAVHDADRGLARALPAGLAAALPRLGALSAIRARRPTRSTSTCSATRRSFVDGLLASIEETDYDARLAPELAGAARPRVRAAALSGAWAADGGERTWARSPRAGKLVDREPLPGRRRDAAGAAHRLPACASSTSATPNSASRAGRRGSATRSGSRCAS